MSLENSELIVSNNILILLKSISALYFENMANDDGVGVIEEINELVKGLKISNSTGLGSEGLAEESLMETVKWMIGSLQGDKVKFTRDNIMQRLMVNLHCDNEYVEIAKKYLKIDTTPEEARAKVSEIMSELRYEKRREKIKNLIKDANSRLNFKKDIVDVSGYVQNLMSELEEINTKKEGEISGFIGRINFLKSKEIEEVLTKTAESYNVAGVLNTGFQGLNKSTGVGGLRRGEFVNFGATTHNYKSGMLIDLALNIPAYNDPWMWDEKKKPLVLRISFENTIAQDIGIMYKKLHEIKYQEECKLAEINTAKAAKELTKNFSQKGYHFSLETFDPNNFCIFDLFDVINKYILNGFEIHLISCDYLSQISHNTLGDRIDSRITKTYEMARNFCYPKGITFCTGHQLSTEAATVQRDNTSNFTKKVSTGGWYMDCKSLHTKLDLEYILGIHKHITGEKFLCVSRGKHRGGESTPDKHCHFFRKFEQFGGIVPDIGMDDKTLYKLPELLGVDDIGVWD